MVIAMKDKLVTDRYISFCGIECEENADKLIECLKVHLDDEKGDASWKAYFRKKREEQRKMSSDNLHFVGSQINPLYEFFELFGDKKALALLEQIERECC